MCPLTNLLCCKDFYRMLFVAGLIATAGGLLGHWVLFGGKQRLSGPRDRVIKRFGCWERFVHFITVAAFLVLAATGAYSVIGLRSPLHGALWVIHVMAMPVFALGALLVTITWGKDGLFAAYDWAWAKCCGGYLWGKAHAPAGRFNAGQKAYFWMVPALGLVMLITGLGRVYPVFGPLGQEILYQVHRYGALAFVLGAVVHLYLGTIGNPGTFMVMLTGKVSKEWAEKHHPNWYESIKDPEEKK